MSFCSPSEEKNSSRENWEKKEEKEKNSNSGCLDFFPSIDVL